jgi:hypothetical protein
MRGAPRRPMCPRYSNGRTVDRRRASCVDSIVSRLAAFVVAIAVCRHAATAAPTRVAQYPEPPQQHAAWTAPQTPLGAAAGRMFDQRFADPRGCEYRDIEIAQGYWPLAERDRVIAEIAAWLKRQ